jgi:hypothetical protein
MLCKVAHQSETVQGEHRQMGHGWAAGAERPKSPFVPTGTPQTSYWVARIYGLVYGRLFSMTPTSQLRTVPRHV